MKAYQRLFPEGTVLNAQDAEDLEQWEVIVRGLLVLSLVNAVLFIPSGLAYLVFGYKFFLFLTLLWTVFAVLSWFGAFRYEYKMAKRVKQIKRDMDMER